MNKHASATGLLQGGQIPGFKVRGLYPCPKPCFPAVFLWMGHVTILQPSFLIKTNKHVKPGSTFLPFCLFHGKAVVIDMTAQALQQHKEPWSICAHQHVGSPAFGPTRTCSGPAQLRMQEEGPSALLCCLHALMELPGHYHTTTPLHSSPEPA